MFTLKKHIVFLFILVLLTPTAIQVIHAFEPHSKQIICNSLNEQHLHKLNVNCTNLHLQLNTFSFEVYADYSAIPLHFYTDVFSEQPQQIKRIYTSKKSSRAPPFFIG